MDIALDLAVDLDLALRGHVTDDRQVLADDGWDEFAGARAFPVIRRTLGEWRGFAARTVGYPLKGVAGQVPLRFLGKHASYLLNKCTPCRAK